MLECNITIIQDGMTLDACSFPILNKETNARFFSGYALYVSGERHGKLYLNGYQIHFFLRDNTNDVL